MSATPQTERRAYPRYPLATSIELYHGPTQRDFPARCANISHGGMLLAVPATVPVRAGQPVRLHIGAVGRPEFAVFGERPVDGTIVRVERAALPRTGHLAVGVRFSEA